MGNVFTQPLPGVTANQALKAIDKALVMGASMDGKLLQDAAMAHHKALGSMDAKPVPQGQVMDVFNSFSKITSPVVPNLLYSKVDPGAAQSAFGALLTFKDAVKAAQR